MESQQTTIPTQLPEKTKESPQHNVNSSYEEYPTAFKPAMVVVALVLAMSLVSQNKILSHIYTDAMKWASLDMVSVILVSCHCSTRMGS
jgi:hypothetical protein